MNEILETNVLIIGKSGVGKSSLLNYIFDKELMETGTGRPVTEKGLFTKNLKINDNFIVNLSDTWGLEANKAEEWEKLIHDEIRSQDCKEISDWFHTILFCISAKSSRVEDFEKKIIKGLIEDGNKVIIILTHSDTNNIEEAVEKMSEELVKHTGIKISNIIKVSSVGKKLLGGRETKKFGKEEILSSIQSNLWETICNKLPNSMDKIIDDSLENWYLKSSEYVNNELKWHNSSSNKKLEDVGLRVKSFLDVEMKNLKFKMNNKYNEVYDYYFKLSQVYQVIIKEKIEHPKLDYSFDFKLDMLERIFENIKAIPIILLPLSIYFNSLKIRDKRKEDILKDLTESREELSKQLKLNNKKQIQEIRKYDVNFQK